jgi:RNA repair, ligase-Pnkp-associating, region of Hen1
LLIVLLTIRTTVSPASDLGYLLHKHPGRVQAFEMSVGTAHVFYPEVSDECTTAALLLEVDPVGLVRSRRDRSGDGFALGQYVSDRPYAASSMLAVAIKEVYRTALTGRCDSRQELAATSTPGSSSTSKTCSSARLCSRALQPRSRGALMTVSIRIARP